MKLEQLKHLIEIEKQRSISKAAKALYVGQPTLSASLTALEEEIGVKLFERTYTGVVSTEAGIEAVHLAKQALAATDGIMNLGKKGQNENGTVTVLLASAYSYLYNEIVFRFRERYPNAKLRLLVRSYHEIISEIQDSNADIGLTPVVENSFTKLRNTLKRKDYTMERFGDYRIKAFVGPDNQHNGDAVITLEELKKEQLIASFSEVTEFIQDLIQPERPILVVADNEALKQIICQGAGIALLPEMYEYHSFPCANRDIKCISLEDDSMIRILGGLIVKDKQSTLVKETISILEELLKNK